MCPARAAVLRDVLVQVLGDVAAAVNIVPAKGFGQLIGRNVGVRQRRRDDVLHLL